MQSGRRSEEGFTLLEMLVVVMLLGVGFVAILGGMATSMISSTLHRDQAQAETEVRRYAEFIKEATTSTACPATYSSAGFTITAKGPDGATYTAAAPAVTGYLDASGASVACTSTPKPLQIVRVSVSSADGKATESVDLLKRPNS